MYLIGEQHIVLLVDGGVRFIEIAELAGGPPAASSLSLGSENKQISVNELIGQPTSKPFPWQDRKVDLTLDDSVLA